ncbi:hypothetical protein ACVWYN_003482 [Pedobacter sp. UYP24]
MNTLDRINAEIEPIKYNKRYVCLIAANLLVIILYFRLPRKNMFSIDSGDTLFLLLISAVTISYMLFKMTYLFIKMLDRNYPWNFPSLRWLYQILLCVLLPTSIATLVSYFYYRAFGYDLLQSNTKIIHTVIIFLCFVFVNLYYFERWAILARKRIANQKEIVVDEISTPPIIILPEELPLIIISEKEKRWARMPDGIMKEWEHTIEKSLTALPDGDYFILSRDIICRKDNIATATYKNRKYTVSTRIPANNYIVLSEAVTRKHRQFLRSIPV